MGTGNEKRRASRETSGARRKLFRSSGTAKADGLASESDEITTIHAGQGARVTTRKNAAEAADRARKNAEARYAKRHPEEVGPQVGPPRSARNVVLIVIAAFLALAVVFALGTLVTSLLFPPAEQENRQNDQNLRPTASEQEMIDRQEAHDAAQEQAGVDGSVSYGNETYSLSQGEEGTWALVNAAGDVLFEIEGAPAALLRSAETILIPENREDGWDVVCYVIGGHLSGVTYVVDSNGDAVGGSGSIDSVELEDTTLRVTDDSGSTTDVSLV